MGARNVLLRIGDTTYRILVGPRHSYSNDYVIGMYTLTGGLGITASLFPEAVSALIASGIFTGGIRALNEILYLSEPNHQR